MSLEGAPIHLLYRIRDVATKDIHEMAVKGAARVVESVLRKFRQLGPLVLTDLVFEAGLASFQGFDHVISVPSCDDQVVVAKATERK